MATREDNGSPTREDPRPASPPDKVRRPAPVVGIGASAGGLDALRAFFSQMPAKSGIGFIVVTHTRPERVSLLPELLSEVTELPVVVAEEGKLIEPDRIVVAKDSLLTLDHGVLRHVTDDDDPEIVHHPIDYLFRALALDRQEHAIGVVLSGSGSDGTLGIKAIKYAGGMTMAQDPDTADYPSMPSSARGTGLVDYVLPAGELPAALVRYCEGPYLRRSALPDATPLSKDVIRPILVRLRNRTGQDFTGYKRRTMSRRIERRMNVHHITEPRAYLDYLREDPDELDRLVQELLIGVTGFFRDPESFRSLAERAIRPMLESRTGEDPLRIWVPGCATGEEAYSVAIVLQEELQRLSRLDEVQLFATDLDPRAIEFARVGLYPEGIAADIPRERLSQFFIREDSSYRVNKQIRDKIVFAVQNVISDPPFTRVDLIVCRNLLIYLNSETQQRVLPLFHYALRSDGLLFLGSSETPGDSSDLFEVIDGRHKILRRKEAQTPLHPPIPSSARRRMLSPEGFRDSSGRLASNRELVTATQRLLLERFAPCSVLVDPRDTLVYVHGRTGLYLETEQGQPRNDLLAMARQGVRSPLSALLRRARRNGEEMTQRGISVRTNGDTILVDLTVRPLTAPRSLRDMALVIFEPSSGGKDERPPDEKPMGESERQYIERELQYTRENLQSTIEELETSNEEQKSSYEELQSTNEELQSANEELETSREEMQSLNEELSTVNTELQGKVDALGRANDDMNNLLNSMRVAMVFLDTDLRVQRYTEQARGLVRLIASDIGRPLGDLTSSLRYPELMQHCSQVLSDLTPREREVVDDRGRTYLVRILPYRTADNVIDGLILTMVDIERTKPARIGLQTWRSMLETIRQPYLILDAELRILMANEAFYATFRTEPSRTEGRSILEPEKEQWKIPDLRRLLEEALPREKTIRDHRVEIEFSAGNRRGMLLDARRLEQGDGADLILLAFAEGGQSGR